MDSFEDMRGTTLTVRRDPTRGDLAERLQVAVLRFGRPGRAQGETRSVRRPKTVYAPCDPAPTAGTVGRLRRPGGHWVSTTRGSDRSSEKAREVARETPTSFVVNEVALGQPEQVYCPRKALLPPGTRI